MVLHSKSIAGILTKGMLAGFLVLVLPACLGTLCGNAASHTRSTDAISPSAAHSAAESDTMNEDTRATAIRVREELRVFTDWLAANNARGYIGEVGWPGHTERAAQRWNPVAEAWYRDADAAGLWVSYWTSGEWWPPHYALAAYVDEEESSRLSVARHQAAVIEAHPSAGTYSRGVTVSGGEFAAPGWTPDAHDFSNANPGIYDRDWHYDAPESFRYLASRGLKHVRLPFRWERIQPSLGEPLEQAELQRIKDAVSRAHAAGLGVILDVHNFASYRLYDPVERQGILRAIGSPHVPPAYFYDLWLRLSHEFKGNPGIFAYGLMNEPVGMPGKTRRGEAQLWEQVSQEALNIIRGNGDDTLVMVSGYHFSGVHKWSTYHPAAWVSDPTGKVMYEAHHYFDPDHSGEYADDDDD